MAEKVYLCTNKDACPLGARGEDGRFTGGQTAEGRAVLTGEPIESLEEGKDYGEGFCPNCGEKGRVTDETHESVTATEDDNG